MIGERHAPKEDLFALVPELVSDFEPELPERERLVADDALVGRVQADMAAGRPAA